MHEILRNLPLGAYVLDLGSKDGSFKAALYPIVAICLDLEARASPSAHFVRANAVHLPFGPGTFDAVIANHSLEHIEDLDSALAEIRRVLKPEGALYVAVPDATTFSDRAYRWLAHGGGHINAFTSMQSTAARLAGTTGLPLRGSRTLLSSFAFANRNNERWSRRIALLGWGNERCLAALSYVCRAIDGRLSTRLSVYGWAFYFGNIAEPVSSTIWTDVCVRCGAAHPAKELWIQPRFLLPATYRCPDCGARNQATST